MVSRRAFAVCVVGCAVAPRDVFAAERLRATDLWAGGGEFSEVARRHAGRVVAMRGYMAPPLKPEASFFVLTRVPMAVCPFCDTEANWPQDLVLVETRGPVRAANFNDLIEVSGRLDLGAKTDANTGFVSRVRLVEATWTRA